MREKRRKHKADPSPDASTTSDAGGPTIVRRKVSVGSADEPTGDEGPATDEASGEPAPDATGAADDPTLTEVPASGADDSAEDAEATETATAATPTATTPTSDGADQFDALGNEIAAVLRQAQETSERVRAEAAEHAKASRDEAEAEARRIVERAEGEAREKLTTAQTEIEQQWTAAAQQLEEATKALELAREQDRTLRQDAADHLAHALAARDAGTEILQGATRQIERAEAAARDLEAHAEAARVEAAQIAVDLHELAEHFGSGSGVIDLRADAVIPEELAAGTAAGVGDLPAPPPSAADAS